MRLNTRISMGAVLLVITTGILLGVLSIHELRQTLVEEHTEWSATTAQAVAKAVITLTLQRDRVGVRDVLRRVESSNTDLSYLMVVDFHGKIFASTFDGSIPTVLEEFGANCREGATRLLRVNNENVHDVCFPLIKGLEGHLHLGLRDTWIDRVLDTASMNLMWSIALISLLGALGALFIGRRISRPISQLSSALHAFGRGEAMADLSAFKSRDLEIRELVSSFETMVEERSFNEQVLRTRTRQLDTVVNASPVVLFSCDRYGNFTMCEGAALHSLGLEPGQVVGQSIFDVFAANPDIISAARRVLAGETLVETNQQGERVFELHWTPLWDEQHKVEGILGVAVDITERQRAEAQLRKLNEELEQRVRERTKRLQEQATILDQIHDSVVVTDLEGRITRWNKGASLLFGYSRKEAMGRNIGFLYPQGQGSVLVDEIIKPLLDKGVHEVETQTQHKDGHFIDIHLSLTLMRNDQDQPVSMVGYALDISARKRAEQALQKAVVMAEEASRAKSEFLSRMSHELRTPMNAILGFSQLLEQNLDGNLTALDMEYVQEVLKGGHHLLDLINEVLDLSRIESGKMQISLETVELQPLLQECISLIKPIADQHHITIRPLNRMGTGLVKADRIRLKQVILNLLSNAVKYSRMEGEVEIRCEEQDGILRLTIRDSGPGIPESMRERVFVPFDRLDADRSNVEGTGIGLTLAKRLIELMSGQIDYTSIEGQGSSFWIELPVGDALQGVPGMEEPQGTPLTQLQERHHKLLYVEDNPSNLRFIAKLVEQFGGIEFYDAHNVGLALELIRHHDFQLILLDLHLAGGENGFDILHRLRADPALRDIPVVAISANATPGDIERGLAAGFWEYITKPVDIVQFQAMLGRCLGDTPRT